MPNPLQVGAIGRALSHRRAIMIRMAERMGRPAPLNDRGDAQVGLAGVAGVVIVALIIATTAVLGGSSISQVLLVAAGLAVLLGLEIVVLAVAERVKTRRRGSSLERTVGPPHSKRL